MFPSRVAAGERSAEGSPIGEGSSSLWFRTEKIAAGARADVQKNFEELIELLARFNYCQCVGHKPRGLRMQAEIRLGSAEPLFFSIKTTVFNPQGGVLLRF
jgi:hypothetical protein